MNGVFYFNRVKTELQVSSCVFFNDALGYCAW